MGIEFLVQLCTFHSHYIFDELRDARLLLVKLFAYSQQKTTKKSKEERNMSLMRQDDSYKGLDALDS
jgi:hypothetical protein